MDKILLLIQVFLKFKNFLKIKILMNRNGMLNLEIKTHRKLTACLIELNLRKYFKLLIGILS